MAGAGARSRRDRDASPARLERKARRLIASRRRRRPCRALVAVRAGHEIRRWFDGPLVLSGAIATGGAILAAQAMGADLAYIGSPFIATPEANSSDAYKQGIVEASAADIVYTDLFTGVHGNYLRSSIVASGLDPDALAAGNIDAMKFVGRFPQVQGVARHLGSCQASGRATHLPAAEWWRNC